MQRTNIQLYTLGGTIAMARQASGHGAALPSLEGRALLDALDSAFLEGLDADIHVDNLTNKGSANLSPAIIADLLLKASASPADAFVVTQGTDTLEETAFLASLLWRGPRPIIFTAAMRPATAAGADGPANLAASLLLASGVLIEAQKQAFSSMAGCTTAPEHALSCVFVLMNDTLHDPARITKSHTSSVQSFVSDPAPVAYLQEGRLHPVSAWPMCAPIVQDRAGRNLILESMASGAAREMCVPILTPGIGEVPPEYIDASALKGCVLAAYGAGHISEDWADFVGKLADTMPVVLSTRATYGSVLERTYGYKGAEIHLLSEGLVSGGILSPAKARLLLMVILVAYGHEWRQHFANSVAHY